MSHDFLINSQIANRKKRIMVSFGLFLGERAANSKSELASILCYIGPTSRLVAMSLSAI